MITKTCAIHVYYNGNQDALLIEQLIPFLLQIKTNGEISKFFFIRYWNGGNHIRVRLFNCTNKDEVLKKMRLLVQTHQEKYAHILQDEKAYERHADSIKSFHEKNFIKGMERIETMNQGVIVRFSPYKFETHRYGVGKAKSLSEEHFAFSSEFVFPLLKLTVEAPNSRLTLLMHLAMLTVGVIQQSLTVVSELFMQASSTQANIESIEEQATPGGFPSFDEQLPSLENLALQLTEWMESGQNCSINVSKTEIEMSVVGQSVEVNAFLQKWPRELRKLRQELSEIENLLPNSPDNILMTYLHMLFNRAGLSYDVECYTYYLIGNLINHVNQKINYVRD